MHSRKKELLAILSENTIGRGPVVQRSGKSQFRIANVAACKFFSCVCAWTERKETGRQWNGVREERKGGKVDNSAESLCVRVGVCFCTCVASTCVCVYRWKDFRMDVNYRWEHFVTERFSRLTFALSRQLGISVCRIARRDFRSCVTILGQLRQLRLLIASGSWKKTKTPDRAMAREIFEPRFPTREKNI